jgi:Ca-activated chloride channel family protein
MPPTTQRTAFLLATAIALPCTSSWAQTVVPEPVIPQRVWISPQHRPILPIGHPGGIELTAVHVDVTVRGRAAQTEMVFSISNTGSRPAEGVLLVPVPDGAVVRAFSYDGEGIEPTARILPADEARRIYDSIVRRAQDPALLEFAGWNVLRSSVFPVPAGATQEVRISWDQILEVNGDRTDLSIPRSEAVDSVPWTVNIQLNDAEDIGTIYSPSHDIVVNHNEQGDALITSNVTGTMPFLLSWLNHGDEAAATVFTYPDPTIGGGYFLLLMGIPDTDVETVPSPREVTIVLDRSGSMSGEKMRQARAAAMQVISALGPDEAFNIIDYSTTVESFSPGPVAVTDQARAEAETYLASLRATGGTNIYDALLEAIRQPTSEHRRSIVLFMTDGLPTVGRTSERDIRDMVEAGNVDNRRIFTFGVGSDVNAPLLDRVATVSRATSTYVLPGEDVEVKVAAVFERLAGPVCADLQLATSDADGRPSTQLVHDLMPAKLPDLFAGEDLMLLGKYRGEAPVQFKLDGQLRGQQHEFDFTFDLDGQATTRNAFVPRLWAGQRIAWLIDEVRQCGAGTHMLPSQSAEALLANPATAELINEIVGLSLQHGILTEYTAFLATDGAPWTIAGAGLAPAAARGLVDFRLSRGTVEDKGVAVYYLTRSGVDPQVACAMELDAKAVKTRAGQGAVSQSLSLGEQMVGRNLASLNGWWRDDLGRQNVQGSVKQCNGKTFFRGPNVWVDATLLSGEGDTVTPDEIVSFGSEAWDDVVAELIAMGHGAVLALQGPVLLELNNRLVLICGPNDGC